jgi:hypothetical protein
MYALFLCETDCGNLELLGAPPARGAEAGTCATRATSGVGGEITSCFLSFDLVCEVARVVRGGAG